MRKILLGILCVLICCQLLACRDDRIKIPFSLRNNRIIITANVNGRTGNYFWDTGSFLSQVDCRTDNLKYLNTTSFAQLHTSDNISYYQLNEIKFNDITVQAKSEICNIQDNIRDLITKENLDGVLGMNIFNGYWCEISFKKQVIYLSKNKPKHFLKSIKTDIENGYLAVKITTDNIPVKFYIDTGSLESLMFPESIITKKEINTYKKIACASNENINFVKTDEINGFIRKIKNVYVITNSPYSQVYLDGGIGSIGIDYLKYFDLAIDFTKLDQLKTSDILIKENHRNNDSLYGFFSKEPKSGIVRVYRYNNSLLVAYIIEDSQLYKKGLRPLISITHINQVKITDIPQNELREYIDNTKNGTQFKIIDNGLEKIITYE